MRAWVDLEGHACVDGHECGIDVILWTASLLLLHYLSALQDWSGVRLLELSAGAGHLAVGMARLGCHVTATECSPKHGLHAFEAMQRWSAYLLAQSPPRTGSLSLEQLDWGAEDNLDESAASRYDVILLSELVALGEELQAHLFETFQRLLGPSTVAYSIACERGEFSLGFLLLLASDDSILVEQIELPDRLGLHEDEIVYCHKITRRPP